MSNSNQPGLTPGKGLIGLILTVEGVALFIGIGSMLGIVSLYAGFLFLLYFASFKQAAPRELPAALLGSLGGLLIGASLHVLPAQFGAAGMAIALLLILAAIYALLMAWLPLLINIGFMLFLTVSTIPAVQAQADFVGMACAILLAAAFAGVLLLVKDWSDKSKAGQADLNPTTG